MDTENSFGERLKHARNLKGISQQKAAEIFGITKVGYQNYEAGRRSPNLEMFSRLVDVFDVSADYLLGRSDDPHLPRMDDETRSLFLALKALKETHGAAK